MGLMDWGPAVGGVIGGLLGGNSSPSSATSRQEMDPVVKANVYKQLAGTSSLYDQQMAQGGLNDVQRAGLQQQLNVYSDPSYNAGFQQMRSLGGGLLGQPIAGNPFTNGGMADGSWRRGLPAMAQAPQAQPFSHSGAGYMPANFDPAQAFKQSTYVPPAPPSPAAIQNAFPMIASNGVGASGHSAPEKSEWDRMGDVEKAQYYADNPTMAKITQMLQLGFSLTDIAKLQNKLDPGFADKQAQIASGDGFGQGLGPGFGDFSVSRDTFAGLGPGDISQLGVDLGKFGDQPESYGLTGLVGGYGGYGDLSRDRGGAW